MGHIEGLIKTLGSIDTAVLSGEDREDLAEMLRKDLRVRVDAVNAQDGSAWAGLKGQEAWEAFVGPRLQALRKSLGTFPEVSDAPEVLVSGTVMGDGYRIENLVFESRPGLPVAANLYLPDSPGESMPGFLLVHSHHNPKVQGELQDMGMMWAKQGCAVLVMDQLAYGERRQHAPGSRQDYRFRYVSGVQLQLMGDSLMGWMVWDIRRGIDLLKQRYAVERV
ncbi:MAG: hypothetical protein O2954_20815, partial [bacterium]|nr:hypothetical protein [bacterium]